MMVWDLEYWLDTAEEAQNAALQLREDEWDVSIRGVYSVPEVGCLPVRTLQSCIVLPQWSNAFPQTSNLIWKDISLL